MKENPTSTDFGEKQQNIKIFNVDIYQDWFPQRTKNGGDLLPMVISSIRERGELVGKYPPVPFVYLCPFMYIYIHLYEFIPPSARGIGWLRPLRF